MIPTSKPFMMGSVFMFDRHEYVLGGKPNPPNPEIGSDTWRPRLKTNTCLKNWGMVRFMDGFTPKDGY